MDKRTFTFLGVRYTAPASLDGNIREWFAHNAPTATIDAIPADARFTVVHAALAASPSSPLPTWCTAIDSTARNLIYYCVAAAARRIVQENGEKQEKHCFFPKKCVFFLASSPKSTYLCSVKKKKK